MAGSAVLDCLVWKRKSFLVTVDGERRPDWIAVVRRIAFLLVMRRQAADLSFVKFPKCEAVHCDRRMDGAPT